MAMSTEAWTSSGVTQFGTMWRSTSRGAAAPTARAPST